METTISNVNYYACSNIINTYRCNILKELPKNKYDIIVSNPPYIPFQEINNLEHSVKYYDPLDALTDYSDGMNFYKRIADISKFILNKNGLIIFEFGTEDQEKKIIDLFYSYPYQTFNDLDGKPRIIMFQL